MSAPLVEQTQLLTLEGALAAIDGADWRECPDGPASARCWLTGWLLYHGRAWKRGGPRHPAFHGKPAPKEVGADGRHAPWDWREKVLLAMAPRFGLPEPAVARLLGRWRADVAAKAAELGLRERLEAA